MLIALAHFLSRLTIRPVTNIIHIMKTIAITIDETALERIDKLVSEGSPSWKSRSEIIRKAVREFLSRLERATEDEREREVFRRAKARLNRQAAALIKEQARP